MHIPMLKATYSLTCFSKSTSICSNLRINLALPKKKKKKEIKSAIKP